MNDIVFHGIDSKECESFIRAVAMKAFEAERDSDDNWTARFAATCFEGPALRWYDQLPEETQGSWRLLRKALLAHYPAETTPSKVPIPAAAKPSPTTATWNFSPSGSSKDYASHEDRLIAEASPYSREDVRNYLRSRAASQKGKKPLGLQPNYFFGASSAPRHVPEPRNHTRRIVGGLFWALAVILLLLFLSRLLGADFKHPGKGVKSSKATATATARP